MTTDARVPRILLAEGNPREHCDAMAAKGATDGSTAYLSALKLVAPEAEVTVVRPADTDAYLPAGTALADFDGAVLGGGALNIPDGVEDGRIARQIDFAIAVFGARIPFLGSCWGLQIAAAAAGGTVRTNPLGRELGIARKIRLTAAGRGSDFYFGKADVFDSPAIHYDEVIHLPPGSVVLAENAFTSVQAAEISYRGGTMLGVQYHPEFDLMHIVGLIRAYADKLVNEGVYADEAAARHHADHLAILYDNPDRKDLAWLYGIDADVLDARIRCREIGNWIERRVFPAMAARGR